MNQDLKRCSNCKIEKILINFHKDIKQKDGLYNQCTVCRKEYYNENLFRIKKYFLDNRN